MVGRGDDWDFVAHYHEDGRQSGLIGGGGVGGGNGGGGGRWGMGKGGMGGFLLF